MMNALLDLVCTAVWAWRRDSIIRAEERARTIGTWAPIAKDYPTDVGSGPVRWTARGA
jgi:hypothetical protein